MKDVTEILERMRAGESSAARDLWEEVYAELRKLAAFRIHKDGGSLKATELVHEAYIRLVDRDRLPDWEGRGHFFGSASEAMRRILIDLARKRNAAKRGGDVTQIDLDVGLIADDTNASELLTIDEAITELESHDQCAATLVKLRFFGGMKQKDAADVLGITRRQADRMWLIARTWLKKEISKKC